ncbi:protein shisa-like-1 isoform X2 [Chelonoidis abingdonii]|uniref:protein shisa-like-1 isoform X2 n=1 Tax=Chelonoidis abingdonii TaxID=106734 RepID=UPI0013F20409|nr:protein shisa-like-1 isoform X2 [Chelonoidis abingdonii]
MEAGAGGAVVSVSSDWSLSCLCPRSRQEDAARTPAGWPPLHHTSYQLPWHRYCCHHGDHTLKSCCPQLDFESLRRVNLSNVPTPARFRNPLPLLAVGLYGLLILTLMTLDFLHFCRLNQHRIYSLLSSSRLGKRLASSFPHRCPRPGPAQGGTQRQELPTARPVQGGTQRQELPTAWPGGRRDPVAGAGCDRGPAQPGQPV